MTVRSLAFTIRKLSILYSNLPDLVVTIKGSPIFKLPNFEKTVSRWPAITELSLTPGMTLFS